MENQWEREGRALEGEREAFVLAFGGGINSGIKGMDVTSAEGIMEGGGEKRCAEEVVFEKVDLQVLGYMLGSGKAVFVGCAGGGGGAGPGTLLRRTWTCGGKTG